MQEYLEGKILTGDKESVSSALMQRRYPVLPQLIEEELSRLSHAYANQTGIAGVNPIRAFASVIGYPEEELSAFIKRHSAARRQVYLSDPFIVRDLYDERTMPTSETLMDYESHDNERIRFFPLTSWKKAGNAPLRFGLADMHTHGGGTVKPYTVRFPVVMIDNGMMDIIQQNDPELQTLKHFHHVMKLACHDYFHTTCLYYGQGNAEGPMASWNNALWEGKEIWQQSRTFKQNYELLACIGHRQVMEQLYREHPGLKDYLLGEALNFDNAVEHIGMHLRNTNEGMAKADQVERYLMTNFSRFLFHIVHPNDPEFAWLHEKYPFIREDLNLHNGKGLVSMLHAHDGVPAGHSGNQDVPFRDWLRDYIPAMTKHIDMGLHLPRFYRPPADKSTESQISSSSINF